MVMSRRRISPLRMRSPRCAADGPRMFIILKEYAARAAHPSGCDRRCRVMECSPPNVRALRRLMHSTAFPFASSLEAERRLFLRQRLHPAGVAVACTFSMSDNPRETSACC